MKHFKLILRSLFSNNACVEAARTKETKYSIIAIIFAMLAVFLAVLPNTINAFRKNGQDWMNTSINYDLEQGLYEFTHDMNDKLVFNVVKDEKGIGYLDLKQEDWKNCDKCKYLDDKNNLGPDEKVPEDVAKGKENELNRYVYNNKQYGNGRSLEVFVDTNLSDEKFNKFASYVLSNINPYKKLKDEKIPDDQCYLYYTVKDGKNIKVERSTNTIIFGKHNVYAYMFKPDTPTPVSSVGGDYNNFSGDIISACFGGNEKLKETYDKWKDFFNKSYLVTRWRSAWTSTGIMAGVDVGVILFMGFMIWILTRGKNNPFRIYTLWDGQKIAYYSSLMPGIIALILGFLMSQMAMMLFVLICGVRIMWLSMRTLKPAGAGK